MTNDELIQFLEKYKKGQIKQLNKAREKLKNIENNMPKKFNEETKEIFIDHSRQQFIISSSEDNIKLINSLIKSIKEIDIKE